MVEDFESGVYYLLCTCQNLLFFTKLSEFVIFSSYSYGRVQNDSSGSGPTEPWCFEAAFGTVQEPGCEFCVFD